MIRKGSNTAKILAILRQARGSGRTTREIAAKVEIDPQVASTTMRRMRHRGLVKLGERLRKCSVTGEQRNAWVLTEDGTVARAA